LVANGFLDLEIMSFLHVAWFTLNLNINSQNNSTGIKKIPMQFIKFLCMSLVYIEGAPMVFKETINSYCYIPLINSILSRLSRKREIPQPPRFGLGLWPTSSPHKNSTTSKRQQQGSHVPKIHQSTGEGGGGGGEEEEE
jgi:hypothetical protein